MKKKTGVDEISAILEKELADFGNVHDLEEIGTVLSVGDGVARVYGLANVGIEELVVFEGGQRGIALSLKEDHVGVMILGDAYSIKEGDQVRRTNRVASIRMGEGLIGRVVNALGEPQDGKGPITGNLVEMPLEREAPGVIDRDRVEKPCQTGYTKIDSLIPVGLGQRMLIIGDRQTGKTTLGIDTIINQRERFEKGDPVYCIYVAIGQKAANVAHVVSVLTAHGAMEYTTIVLAPASSPASLQLLAPYTGAAMGEFFRDTGRHALIVFDDLSKHAVAYREISLLLKRFPAREAFPGDVFYLASRLLERGAQINENDEIAAKMKGLPNSLKKQVRGGGTLTMFPIVETQEGDVSAYIPTNIISITDGQIFLEAGLFKAGIRPAVNIGISVSRIGGAAQLKSMKKIAGPLKLELAQFQSIEKFSKFDSDIDPATKRTLDRGRKSRQILNQGAHQPIPVEQQMAVLYACVNGFLDKVILAKVTDFAQAYINALLQDHPDLLLDLKEGRLTKDMETTLCRKAEEVYKANVDDFSAAA
ncbi:MAG: F0F1 ATP synthase subunit alpha [Cytophagales bacterium]